MPKVRGMFKVMEQTRWDFNRKSALAKLESVEGDMSSPDHTLTASTAAASLSIMITNPKLVKLFAPGKHFVVDFTQVPKPRKRKASSK